MKQMLVTITGTSPLLMHSDRLSNPLHESTKKHKQLTSKRKKTDDDQIEIARSEWMNSLYYDEKVGVHIPTMNIRKSLIEGARLNKLGKHIERGVIFMDEKTKVIFDGPQTPEKMWNDGRFTDARSVVVSRSRLMRYRPIFHEWRLENIFISYDETIVNGDDIKCAFKNAGMFSGLGDFRPMFGRYEVETAE